MIYEFAPSGLNLWSSKNRRRTRILMIPGFWAGDQSLYPLAWWLDAEGYRVFFAGIWWNTGCPRETVERLHQSLKTLYAADRDKIVIIGHSLGGIYGRELARRAPDMVERVVLMGSAITHPLASTNPMVAAVFMVSRSNHPDGTSCLDSLETLCGTHHLEPPGVPETIVYSKRDEVVDWSSCLEAGDNVECIEVDSSHYTLPYRPEVRKLILVSLERKPVETITRTADPAARVTHYRYSTVSGAASAA